MQHDYVNDFIKLQKDLSSFIYRLTCNKEEAEDIVQDTFLAITKHLSTFKEESSFKTWIYSIAINKAKNSIKVKKRWNVNFQDKGEALHLENSELLEQLVDVYQVDKEKEFEIKEHINYCFNCISKTLSLSQQICLWLKEFYGFTKEEIIAITNLTEGSVKHNLTYARKNMNEIFEKRCAFINKNGTCHQCTSLKGDFKSKTRCKY